MAGGKRGRGEDYDIEKVLEIAKEAALTAGKVIASVWKGTSAIKETKSNDKDLVTETDQKCEEIISGILKAAYPDHEYIGEETVGSGKYQLTDAPTWTIDPIDGTTNFVHRIPQSCVLIAFIVKKEVLMGVTYDPIGDELFWATKGGGAFVKNPRYEGPMRCSGCTSISQAVVGTESGYRRDPQTVSMLSGTIADLMRGGVRSLRMMGACGLNVSAVAAGRFDAFYEVGGWENNAGPKIWDFSAGRLLVEEAGGVVRSPDGGPFDLMGRSAVCAATPELMEELLAIIKQNTQAT